MAATPPLRDIMAVTALLPKWAQFIACNRLPRHPHFLYARPIPSSQRQAKRAWADLPRIDGDTRPATDLFERTLRTRCRAHAAT